MKLKSLWWNTATTATDFVFVHSQEWDRREVVVTLTSDLFLVHFKKNIYYAAETDADIKQGEREGCDMTVQHLEWNQASLQRPRSQDTSDLWPQKPKPSLIPTLKKRTRMRLPENIMPPDSNCQRCGGETYLKKQNKSPLKVQCVGFGGISCTWTHLISTETQWFLVSVMK